MITSSTLGNTSTRAMSSLLNAHTNAMCALWTTPTSTGFATVDRIIAEADSTGCCRLASQYQLRATGTWPLISGVAAPISDTTSVISNALLKFRFEATQNSG